MLGTVGLPPDNWKITNKKKNVLVPHLKKTDSNFYFAVLSQCEIKLCVKGQFVMLLDFSLPLFNKHASRPLVQSFAYKPNSTS